VKVAGYLGGQFAFRFFPQLWPQPAFYLQWLGQIDGVTGFSTFVLAVTGIFVARQRGMRLLAGLWLGYFAYGMTFAYHITTHDYYQIPLIPIVALSLSPVAETLFEQANKLRAASDSGTSSPGSQGLNRYGSLIIRVTLALLITLVTAIQIWNVRVELIRDNWRPDAEFWAMLGEKLGHNDPVLAIAQDYGYRLAYWGWEKVDSWYDSGDLALRALDGRQVNLLQRFQQQVVGKHFLVVTQSNRFDQQPEIKAYVYKTYPIFDEGKGYIIFDLTKQIPTK
jgi:hypothetical protein